MCNPRYVVEALDRTLGGDWFQVGEAAPGDRKVGNITILFCISTNVCYRERSSHWSTSTGTGSG